MPAQPLDCQIRVHFLPRPVQRKSYGANRAVADALSGRYALLVVILIIFVL